MIQQELENFQEQLTVTRTTIDRHLTAVRKDVLALDIGNKKQHGISGAFLKPASKLKWFPDQSYPRFPDKLRFEVPPHLVDWSQKFHSYKPVEFTAGFVLNAAWSDQEPPESIEFNKEFPGLSRKTCQQTDAGEALLIQRDPETKRPLNPYGRTGMTGRGVLGKWGVNWAGIPIVPFSSFNCAADTVVTRWRRQKGVVMERDGKKVLEFVAIERRDERSKFLT